MTTVCLTFDFDALSIWVSTFKLTSPTPLSRGEYGARVGLGRVLKMLERHAVPATFFAAIMVAVAWMAAAHRRISTFTTSSRASTGGSTRTRT